MASFFLIEIQKQYTIWTASQSIYHAKPSISVMLQASQR